MSATENPFIGPYVMNYYVDLKKKQLVVQTADGDYRIPLPKRKDGFALEQMLLAACMEYNLDYVSPDWIDFLFHSAVDSYWFGFRSSMKA